MAQKRMLDKKISVSEDVASLSTEAQLLFTWMIPHADDVGLLPYSARAIKALVVPMKDWSVEDIGIHLEDIRKKNLTKVFTHAGEKYWQLTSFVAHQTLKKDRQPQTNLKIELMAHTKDSWECLEDIVFQTETKWNLKEGRKRRKEEKEDRKIETGKGYEKAVKTYREKLAHTLSA